VGHPLLERGESRNANRPYGRKKRGDREREAASPMFREKRKRGGKEAEENHCARPWPVYCLEKGGGKKGRNAQISA